MVKEVKVFETSDGKTFKTAKGAENYEKKIQAAGVLEGMDMTKDEVSEALQKAASYNKTVSALLKHEPDWAKWPRHLIGQVNDNLLKEPDKKTLYVREYWDWGAKEKEIAVELGDKFTKPELYLEGETENYKLIKVEEIDDYTMKVYYDYALSWEERMELKIKNGEKLTESEIESMLNELPEEYEEEGEDRRWSRSMTTVVEMLGKLYAIDWEHGLTERQENSYDEQPYLAKIKTQEVTVTQTYIVKVEE